MNRKLKKLGIVTAAVMAVVVISAPAGSAATFHSEAAHTTLSGSQIGEDVLSFNAGTVKCTSVTYAGTQSSATSETLSLKPSFSGCAAFGFVNTPVTNTGCEYKFNADTSSMDIVCAVGKIIVIHGFNCIVTIGTQTGIPALTYTNEGSGKTRDIKVSLSLTGVKYTQHRGAFPYCIDNNTEPFKFGSYSASFTLKGANTTGEQVGIWHG